MKDYNLAKMYISLLKEVSDAYKEGIECASEQFVENIGRLPMASLMEVMSDCRERAKTNFEYAKDKDAADFQLGYIAFCSWIIDGAAL